MHIVKSSKSIGKRFKITAKGKIVRKKASRSHLLQKKTSKRKRKLRQKSLVNFCDISNFINKIYHKDR